MTGVGALAFWGAASHAPSHEKIFDARLHGGHLMGELRRGSLLAPHRQVAGLRVLSGPYKCFGK